MILYVENLSVQVTDVSLYCYFNDLYLLSISVKPVVHLDTRLHQDGKSWWQSLFFSEEKQFKQIQALQLSAWLSFTRQARIIYPSFREQIKENKIARVTLETSQQKIEFHSSDSFSPVIAFFLNHFFCEQALQERFHNFPDDRMFVCPAYGLVGEAPSTPFEHAHLRRLFSLALYVDRVEDTFKELEGYAYDPSFTQQLLRQDSLARWQGLGIYAGYCRYANVYVGFGTFFGDVIAPTHVPYIYGRMLVLALFYQLTLRHYNRRVSYATAQLSKNSETREFRRLRQEFIQFTNNYWFHEVTAQTQGLEIFTLQMKSLNVNAEYQLIKDEMERADEYSNILRSETFNQAAGMVAIVALIISVLEMLSRDQIIDTWAWVSGALAIGVIGRLVWLWIKK